MYKHRLIFQLFVLFASVLTSFTGFYSVGYILIVTLIASLTMSRSAVFRTSLQRLVLSIAIFIAVIPFVGIVCWLIGTEVLPIYNITAFISFVLLLHKSSDDDHRYRLIVFDRVDFVAITASLIPIVILIVSYGVQADRSTALFQLASEGWDNGSHILMLEDVGRHKGYVYGPYDDLKNEIIQKSNAYPQAWHLITADISNGFGSNQFDPGKPIETIGAYMLASVFWMMSACYLSILGACRFYERLSGKKIRSFKEIIPIFVLSLAVQSIVIYGSLASGFANYIGSVVYLLLLLCVLLGMSRDSSRNSLLLSLLFGTISVLLWFLTLPAIALTLLGTVLLSHNQSTKINILTFLKDWRTVLVGIIGLSAVVIQVYIFEVFSSEGGGSSQLNAGVKVDAFNAVIGVFPVNQLLYSLIIGACIYWLMFNIGVLKKTQSLAMLLIIPWLFLSLGVFFYQNITTGHNSYYLPKVLGLSLISACIVACALFAVWINRSITNTRLALGVVSIGSFVIVGLLILGTGQSTYGLNKLFQGNANTTYVTAEKIVDFLHSADFEKQNIVIMRNKNKFEDFNGRLQTRVVHQPLNCSYRITGWFSFKTSLKRLSSCADILKKEGRSITVITSDESKNQVLALKKSNVIVKNVPR